MSNTPELMPYPDATSKFDGKNGLDRYTHAITRKGWKPCSPRKRGIGTSEGLGQVTIQRALYISGNCVGPLEIARDSLGQILFVLKDKLLENHYSSTEAEHQRSDWMIIEIPSIKGL